MIFTASIAGEEACAGDSGIFPYWSFTKTLLAAAILALARDGKLTLDEPWRGKPFSLRQLLSHRAGVPNYNGLADYHAAVARGDDAWPLEDMLARAGAKSLLFAPGTGCAYSNIGYALLRREIEDQAASALDAAMQALVFGPLGVRDVRMALTRADMQSMTWSGLRDYDPGWVYHGLAVGTPLAAVQLLHRLMTTDFLPQASKAQMFRGTPVDQQEGAFANPALGTGIMIGTAPGLGLCAGHSGGGPGSVCAIYHFWDSAFTAAAFAEGDDQRAVERAVIQLAAA